MMKNTIVIFILILLSGCASKQPVVDNSMKNPTAVFTAKGAISGFVLPDSTFTESTYTREDRRFISTKHEFDSWFARQFFGNSNDTVIYRMDRDLRWSLVDDDGDKTYTECPLSGCAMANIKKYDPKKNTDKKGEPAFDYDPNDKQASLCPIHITQNTFKVTSTGKSREISGHLSNEYRANWVVEYADEKGRKDSNRLQMVFWTAQPNAEMKKVMAISSAADKAYLKKIKQDTNALTAMIPDDVFIALSAFTGSLSGKKIASEMAKVKGQSMATTVEWYLDRKACIEPQQAKKEEGFDWTNPMGALNKTASNMASDKAAEMFLPNPDEPILRYDYEVTDVGIKYERDSIFDVPQGYKRVTPK